MLTVTAVEFQKHFGRYQDEALTQPVRITRNGRARLVMISANEYERLTRGAGVGDKNSDNKRSVKKKQ